MRNPEVEDLLEILDKRDNQIDQLEAGIVDRDERIKELEAQVNGWALVAGNSENELIYWKTLAEKREEIMSMELNPTWNEELEKLYDELQSLKTKSNK